MRIKEAIKESGSSVGDLAQKMGVSRQAISWQINGANITVGTVQRIAEVLGVPVWQLFVSSDDFIKANANDFRCPHCGKKIRVNLSKVDE